MRAGTRSTMVKLTAKEVMLFLVVSHIHRGRAYIQDEAEAGAAA